MLDVLMTNLPMVLCLVMGMGLMVVEVFLPGFGLPGISGIVLIGAGTLIASWHFGTLTAVGILLVILAVLAVLISWVLRSAAKGDMGRSALFLHDAQEMPGAKDMEALVGRVGETSSVLRPAGIANFDGVRLNVVTEGSFIESGVPVEIIRVEGKRIVVRQRAQG